MRKATTEDSKSVTVDYTIENSDITQDLEFNIYRSSSPTIYDQTDLVASATLPASDSQHLTQGDHTGVKLDLGGEQLTIDPSHPYVIVVANADQNIIEADEANEKDDTAAFRKYILGVVTHGFTFSFPKWVSDMAGDVPSGVANSLLANGYDKVISFDWSSYSSLPKSDQTDIAGLYLSDQIIAGAKQLVSQPDQLASNGQALPGSVVDLHLIGHSRGSVVISQAFLDLVGTTMPVLQGGFKRMTMLDPHPGNNSFGPFSSDSTTQLGWLASTVVTLFQAATDDPQVVVPANVGQAEVYYQQTNHSLTPSLDEQILNL